MPKPVAITVAPNGAYKTKSDHPAIPLTAPELAQCARLSLDAGAGMIHLHVRDGEGRHLLDSDAYAAAIAAVRKAVGEEMVLQITSEAAGRYQAPEQMAVVKTVCPEAVSVGLREIVRCEADILEAERFFAWLHRQRVMTQIILYSSEDLESYRALRRRGIFGDIAPALLFVLGRYTAGQKSSPRDLLPFLTEPVSEPWSVCAFGPDEAASVLTAAMLGGHGRVGFENNLFLVDGQVAPDNVALVRQFTDGLSHLGFQPATATEIRGLYR